MPLEIAILAVSMLAFGAAMKAWFGVQRLRRAELIRTYRWPHGLLSKLESHHPNMTRKDAALVSRALRQFFIAYLMSGKKYVSMPSQIVDDLWHEFILYTKDYKEFCNKAFGEFLHHTPATALSSGQKRSNEGLRRVWWYTCKYESIDPRHPTRLPLLFAIDAKLNVPNGFRYHPNCDQLRRDERDSGAGSPYCGGDFSSDSFDGGTDGFGDSGSGGDGDGGGGDGGGCGGGD